ncbi:MAG: maturation protein [Sanya solspi-like virus 3]|nr:MAG: maturation protein [Sanya solspi-like virus 3]
MSYNRYRDEGGFTEATPVQYYKTNDSVGTIGIVASAGSARVGSYGEFKTMSDVVTDKFYKRRKDGEIVINPLSARRLTCSRVEGPGVRRRAVTGWYNSADGKTYYAETWGDRHTVDNAYNLKYGLASNSYPAVRELISGNALGDLITEASTACRSNRGRGDINMWENVAEFDETLGMLPSALRDLKRILGNDGGGGFVRRMNHLSGGLSSLYLLYRFGLQPIMSDISTILKEGQSKAGKKVRMTTRASAETSSTKTEEWVVVSSTLAQGYRQITSDTAVARAMSIDEFTMTRALELGFSGKDLVTLPWELVTRSFVYDYFVNLGEYLGALVPDPSVKQLGSCVVLHRHIETSCEAAGTYGSYAGVTSPSTILIPMQGGFVSTKTAIERIPQLASPGIVVRGSFKLDNLTRALTLGALAVQSFGNGILAPVSKKEERMYRRMRSNFDRALRNISNSRSRRGYSNAYVVHS